MDTYEQTQEELTERFNTAIQCIREIGNDLITDYFGDVIRTTHDPAQLALQAAILFHQDFGEAAIQKRLKGYKGK